MCAHARTSKDYGLLGLAQGLHLQIYVCECLCIILSNMCYYGFPYPGCQVKVEDRLKCIYACVCVLAHIIFSLYVADQKQESCVWALDGCKQCDSATDWLMKLKHNAVKENFMTTCEFNGHLWMCSELACDKRWLSLCYLQLLTTWTLIKKRAMFSKMGRLLWISKRKKTKISCIQSAICCTLNWLISPASAGFLCFILTERRITG